MIGCICLGISLPIFGEAVEFNKYTFVVMCIISRFFIGFGSGCINAASASIIAFNYPHIMGKLIAAVLIVCSIGMMVGQIYGAVVQELLGYKFVFLINGAVVLFMLILISVKFPQSKI